MANMPEHLEAKMRLIERRQLELAIGLGRSTIYARMDPDNPSYDPTFPKPIVLSGKPGKATCVRWVESEVNAWIAAQIEKSRKAA